MASSASRSVSQPKAQVRRATRPSSSRRCQTKRSMSLSRLWPLAGGLFTSSLLRQDSRMTSTRRMTGLLSPSPQRASHYSTLSRTCCTTALFFSQLHFRATSGHGHAQARGGAGHVAQQSQSQCASQTTISLIGRLRSRCSRRTPSPCRAIAKSSPSRRLSAVTSASGSTAVTRMPVPRGMCLGQPRSARGAIGRWRVSARARGGG